MIKRLDIHQPRHAISGHALTKTACAVILLGALTSGAALAQTVPAAHHTALGTSVAGAAAPLLTLQTAISLARHGNLDLAVARRELAATQGQILQGQASPNPELAYTLEDHRPTDRSQSLQLNLPLELGGKRAARVAAAERGRDIAHEELALRQIEIRASVIARFFEVLAAQERTSLALAAVDLAKQTTLAVAKRVAAGKVSPVEESKAQVAEAEVRIELVQAQSEQRMAVTRLASLFGVPRQFTQVAGDINTLPTLPSPASLRQRIATAPALRLAQLETARQRALLDVARSKRVPDLALSIGVKRDNSLQRNQLLLGLAVPLPLFDTNRGNVLEAHQRAEKAADEFAALKLRLDSELWQAHERLESLLKEIDVLQKDVLPGAERAYLAARIGFEAGKFNFLEVLDAQRTHFAAKSHYLKAAAQAHGAAADLERLLGEPAAISTTGATGATGAISAISAISANSAISALSMNKE